MGESNGMGRKSPIWKILTCRSMVLDTILHHEITRVSPYGHQPLQNPMQSNHETHPSRQIAIAGHQSPCLTLEVVHGLPNDIKEWVYRTSGRFKVSSNFGLLYSTVTLQP
jgi:hypothetical protein